MGAGEEGNWPGEHPPLELWPFFLVIMGDRSQLCDCRPFHYSLEVLGMAVWELSIEKQLLTEYWLNVYHCDVATQAEAKTVADAIVEAEQAITMGIVTFNKMRIRQVSSAPGPGTVYPIGSNGTLPQSPYLPLFNVCRIDFAVPVGRPSRKYIKQPIAMSSVSNGQFQPSALTFFQTEYCTPILSIPGICASDGQPFLNAAPIPAVGMRQLRRGTRKKSTPIIP